MINIYLYAAMVFYMFILHVNNVGRETFTSVSFLDKFYDRIPLKIPIMLLIIFALCYFTE